MPVTHSWSLSQLERHAVPAALQSNGAQLVVPFWLQVPLPLQNDWGWYVLPVHETAVPHGIDVDCCWQAPETQAPVLPHTPFAAQFGGSPIPSGTLAQVPLPLTLHDWQDGQLDVVQQTPSVQLPLMH